MFEKVFLTGQFFDIWEERKDRLFFDEGRCKRQNRDIAMSKRGKGGTVAEGKRKKREKKEKKERHVELKEAKVERPRNGGEREGGGGMEKRKG